MTGASFVGVAAALALVLALIALLVRVLRGMALGAGGVDGPRFEVLARSALAPKQGVAAVRFEGRTALVSYGEGGVRMLLDVGAASAGDAPSKREATPPAGRPTAFGDLLAVKLPPAGVTASGVSSAPAEEAEEGRSVGVLPRVRRALRARSIGLGLVLALAFGGAFAAPAAGQARAATAAATQAAAGSAATAGADDQEPAEGRPVEALLAEALRSMGIGSDAEGDTPLQLAGPVGTVIFLGFLTLLPTLLLLMTSFTRILIVLHLLKQAIGTQTAPPAHLLAAMALLLTGFVMAPTLSEVNRRALTPWMDGGIDEAEMLVTAGQPFREFMLETTRESDLAAFVEMSGTEPETVEDIPLTVLTSAFVTSELTNAFKMGFALFLPFIVIDIVVASILMSMGMFMLPPVMVSLPFKLLLFVLVDGWSLVIGSLVQSFGV